MGLLLVGKEADGMDVEKIRRDFPILQMNTGDRPIIYMDSASMALKPRQVIEAMDDYYFNYPSSAGRSVHKLSARVEEARINARETMRQFVGAKKAEEIVFTRNTTEGLNLVTNSLPLKSGDVVLTTDREHNSNLLPCQMLAERKSVKHAVVKSDKNNFSSVFSKPHHVKSIIFQKPRSLTNGIFLRSLSRIRFERVSLLLLFLQ